MSKCLKICSLVLMSLAACQEPGRHPEQAESSLRPAHGVHFVQFDATVRVVFSRSPDDEVGASVVEGYLVCQGADCTATEFNYIDLPGAMTDRTEPVVVWPIGLDGALGRPSEPAVYEVALTIDAASGTAIGEAHDAPAQAPGVAAARQALANAGGPPAACLVQAPVRVFAPVYGPFVALGANVASNRTNAAWSFWQHRAGFHRAGGGINGSNDTFAWDINLNVLNAGANMDVGQFILPVGYGTVTRWGPNGPGVDGARSILVDHCGWFSGYLHASAVYARLNDYVSPWTAIGVIGRAGTNNDHLHVATYSGRNVAGGLVSYNAGFVQNPATVSFVAPPVSVRIGQSVVLSGQGNRTNAASCRAGAPIILNQPAYFNMTWWRSSNPAVLSVDGNGRMTGRAVGAATITLYWSGASRSVNVNVVR